MVILCPLIKEFIAKLLNVDPKKRLNVQQALNNQWVLGKATKFDNMTSVLESLRGYVNKKRTKV